MLNKGDVGLESRGGVWHVSPTTLSNIIFRSIIYYIIYRTASTFSLLFNLHSFPALRSSSCTPLIDLENVNF